MAEPTETRQMSGLARSIDAIFAAAPARVSAAATILEPPPVPQSEPVDVLPPPLPPPVWAPEPEAVPPRPPAIEMFPASQLLDAVQPPWTSTPEPVAPIDPLASEPMPAAEMLPEAEWASPVVEEAPVLEIAPASALEVTRVPERTAGGLDMDALGRAVDEYLDGDATARERVEKLATGLKERLALDPLADAVDKLVRAAGDPPDARHLDLASAVVNPAVASRLVQRLGQESDEPRRQAGFALCRRLGSVMANALKGALTGAVGKDVRRVYYDALISMGDSVRPMIEGMVADDNRFLVRDGVAILGEIGGPRAAELVTSTLADTDPRVRAEALQALARLGDANAGQFVLGCFEDSDADVRMAAAAASGRLGLERAVRPLLHMLEEAAKPEQIVALLGSLGEIGDPGAVPAIEKHAVPSLFSKPSTDVRVAAYRAL
ncbi:MAG: HEAT repeat domain-containing protein, partial [Longimicrobiales bacterium]